MSDWENLNTQQCVGLPCQQTKLSSHVNLTIMANRDVWAVRNPFLASPVAHKGTKALWSGSHLQNLQLTRQQLKRSLPNNCYLRYWQPQGMKTLYRFHHSAQIALTHLLICMIFFTVSAMASLDITVWTSWNVNERLTQVGGFLLWSHTFGILAEIIFCETQDTAHCALNTWLNVTVLLKISIMLY